MLKCVLLAVCLWAASNEWAQAKPWAYKAGVEVTNNGHFPYSICTTIDDLVRFLALAKLKAVETMTNYPGCEISNESLTAVVLQNSGDYVQAMATMPDGAIKEFWFLRGHLRSKKDYAAARCLIEAADNHPCSPDKENWAD